jgi:hypothetical protein
MFRTPPDTLLQSVRKYTLRFRDITRSLFNHKQGEGTVLLHRYSRLPASRFRHILAVLLQLGLLSTHILWRSRLAA